MNSKNLADLLRVLIIAINNFFLFLLFLLIFQAVSAFLFLILLIPHAIICVILTIIYLMIPNPSRLIKRAEVYLVSNFNLLAIDALDKALKADDHMESFYPTFLKEWNLTEDLMSRKQSKIITGALQTVC